ncbi:hypothetical protein FOL47_007306 [Perkinsus chesapeaki]|uniref:Peptidase A1 domain-containing protein n=1 Tax=Perkinsus chesapeaki TaxID=330153 RepID=A0A7J6LLD5_PERCH|nr:hypothetical protein FOL47_007306 [Perkinsus chesapeaki]
MAKRDPALISRFTSFSAALLFVIEMIHRSHAGNVLRVKVASNFITTKAFQGDMLHATVVADGQQMEVLVDTGSSYLFWVWKTYYGGVMGVGACNALFFKCYECLHPCKPTEPTTLKFDGGIFLEIFKHSGDVTLGNIELMNIDFGLVSWSKPSPTKRSYPGILGLRYDMDPKYPAFLKQLVAQGVVEKNVFALYLKPGGCCTGQFEGELLLGGGDAKLFKAPLRYVNTVGEDEWLVGLSLVQIEAESLVVNGRVILDTGCNNILIPQQELDNFIEKISKAASESAGGEVIVEYDDVEKVWAFDCDYLADMPTLYFMLSAPTGDVPLTMNYESYVGMVNYYCYLNVEESRSDDWSLPHFMLVGNYVEFQLDNKRVGIARLKKRLIANNGFDPESRRYLIDFNSGLTSKGVPSSHKICINRRLIPPGLTWQKINERV